MLFNVPQFINVEDKIVGPFTGKQLLWLFVLGVLLLILWNALDKAAFFIFAIPITLVFVAFAFYRPYKQSLISFVIAGIRFVFRPKTYYWERENSEGKKSVAKNKKTGIENDASNKITPEEIRVLAEMLDSRGKNNKKR